MKGYPLHVVVDTYEDLENEAVEPVHRAYCKVKIFRDKVHIQTWLGQTWLGQTWLGEGGGMH